MDFRCSGYHSCPSCGQSDSPSVFILSFSIIGFKVWFVMHLSGPAANLSLKGSPYWMAPEVPSYSINVSVRAHPMASHTNIVFPAALTVCDAEGCSF